MPPFTQVVPLYIVSQYRAPITLVVSLVPCYIGGQCSAPITFWWVRYPFTLFFRNLVASVVLSYIGGHCSALFTLVVIVKPPCIDGQCSAPFTLVSIVSLLHWWSKECPLILYIGDLWYNSLWWSMIICPFTLVTIVLSFMFICVQWRVVTIHWWSV